MDKREILSKFLDFEDKYNEIQKQLEKFGNNRTLWYRENSKEIKKHFIPKKDKVYEILDITKIHLWSYYELNTDETYYFKPTNTRFAPHLMSLSESIPVVQGWILDKELNHVCKHEHERPTDVLNLKEINENKLTKETSRTRVYVMIDKNTGFYKIGRSKNPNRRERTLQSEKPTIEMLFDCSAMVKDESVLHEKFKEKRIRGEWFDLSGSDLNYIKKYFNEED